MIRSASLLALALLAGCAAFEVGPKTIYYNDLLITVSRLDRLEVAPTHAVVFENRAFSIRGQGRIKINGKVVWTKGDSIHVDGTQFDVGHGRSVNIGADGSVSLSGPKSP